MALSDHRRRGGGACSRGSRGRIGYFIGARSHRARYKDRGTSRRTLPPFLCQRGSGHHIPPSLCKVTPLNQNMGRDIHFFPKVGRDLRSWLKPRGCLDLRPTVRAIDENRALGVSLKYPPTSLPHPPPPSPHKPSRLCFAGRGVPKMSLISALVSVSNSPVIGVSCHWVEQGFT